MGCTPGPPRETQFRQPLPHLRNTHSGLPTSAQYCQLVIRNFQDLLMSDESFPPSSRHPFLSSILLSLTAGRPFHFPCQLVLLLELAHNTPRSFLVFSTSSLKMLVTSGVVALLLAAGSASAGVIEKSRYETPLKEDPDFGLCLPTMKYEGGLGGRPATEFSFEPIDALCSRGQPESLNPSKPLFCPRRSFIF